jgi:hypothetical protein
MVRLADHVSQTPLQHRIAVVAEPASPHRCIQLEDRRAEVLGGRPELQ